MKFTDTQKEKIITEITKAGTRDCLMCQSSSLSVSEEVYGILAPKKTLFHMRFASSYIPAVVVTCQECGYIMLFNAITIGNKKSSNKIKLKLDK